MKSRFNLGIAAIFVFCSALAVRAASGQEAQGAIPAQFTFDDLVVVLGLISFVVAASALFSGLYMKKNRKLLFPWHRRLGITTGVCALLHGILAMLTYLSS